MELYKAYRPQRWIDLKGQEVAVKQLQSMVEKKCVPRTLLLTGPSGTGKTTIARILKKELAIGDIDYQEIDCADNNGIDMVRQLKSRINAAPLTGEWRMFLLDECQQLTAAAQDSLLKVLEDTPRHVIFVLNTTEPRKLKETIRTRCTEIATKSIQAAKMLELLKRVCKKAKIKIDEEVVDKIIDASQGSARRALVMLHQIKELEDAEEQIASIMKHDGDALGIDLARKLMDTNSTWGDVAAILKNIDADPEGVRRAILGYAAAILMKQGNGRNSKGDSKIGLRAALVLEAFEDNVFDSGRSGLVLRAYNCYHAK